MALNRKILVPMPNKGITQRKKGRADVFKVTKYFRKDGIPTNKRVCIGQRDTETGMLIPNNNYNLFFCDEVISETVSETVLETVSDTNAESVTANVQYSVTPLEENYIIATPAAIMLTEYIFTDTEPKLKRLT